MLQGMSLSSEELTWLQASALIDHPIEGDDNPFLNNTCHSASSTSLSNTISFNSNLSYLQCIPTPQTASPAPADLLGASNSPVACNAPSYARPPKSPRPEWIYRRPKPPVHARSHCTSPSPSPPHLKGHTSSLSHSNFTAMSFGRSPGNNTISYAHDPFSSTFHPRSHSEQSFSPSLKSIKSQSALKHTPSYASCSKISSPKLMSVRPPSVSSSSSISTSTSRSSSPRTPASQSSSLYAKPRQPLPYRQNPENDSTSCPLSSSCPPSKSILTRTSSISTKDSTFTGNKSVKFAAVPVVHYATASYWDLENFDKEETMMGINVDAMDVDDSYNEYHTHVVPRKDSSGMLDIAKLRESQCTTPTPEREKAKTKGLKRLMSLTRKPVATTATSTSVATLYRSPSSPRPTISMPFPLGTHPTSALQSNPSLPYSTASAGGSAPDLMDGILQLRSVPSLESFRSSKSSAARSVRSMGSIKSTSSTRGLRAWLSRATGWTWGGQPPER
ncbi:hypothetical protein BYT27DRAFT_7211375 [Phlegmacium glaucopus]|nr:hypothetical protein BYT27DRAFT_7211375 [Phlegmacium glaucopus]